MSPASSVGSSATDSDTTTSPRGTTNSDPPRKRRSFASLSMLTVGLVMAAAIGITLLAVFVFPTQQYFEQRNLITENEQRLAQLRQETSQLSEQVQSAQSPASVERRAREKLSLVREGDTLYQLTIDPADSVRLPDDWPLVGVKHLLGVD